MKSLNFGRLNQIKPSDEPLPALPNEDAIAEKHGFVSREPVVRVDKVRKKNQIQDTLYVRGPIDMTNRFKQCCNDQGFFYGEGLAELMRRTGF